MTRYQKASLLIGALILVALIAIVGVLTVKPTSSLSAGDATGTWAIEFAATHAATIQAIGTFAVQTATSP